MLLFVDGVDDLLQVVHGDVSDDGALHRAVDPEGDGPSGVGGQQVGHAPHLVGDGVALVLLEVAIASVDPVLPGQENMNAYEERSVLFMVTRHKEQ